MDLYQPIIHSIHHFSTCVYLPEYEPKNLLVNIPLIIYRLYLFIQVDCNHHSDMYFPNCSLRYIYVLIARLQGSAVGLEDDEVQHFRHQHQAIIAATQLLPPPPLSPHH